MDGFGKNGWIKKTDGFEKMDGLKKRMDSKKHQITWIYLYSIYSLTSSFKFKMLLPKFNKEIDTKL